MVMYFGEFDDFLVNVVDVNCSKKNLAYQKYFKQVIRFWCRFSYCLGLGFSKSYCFVKWELVRFRFD